MRMAPDAPWLSFTADQTFSPLGLDFYGNRIHQLCVGCRPQSPMNSSLTMDLLPYTFWASFQLLVLAEPQ